MKPKLRKRFLRSLKAAITEAEDLYDNVRDAEEHIDDRREVQRLLMSCAAWIDMCKLHLRDDLAEYP